MQRFSALVLSFSLLSSFCVTGCWDFGPDPLSADDAKRIVFSYLADSTEDLSTDRRSPEDRAMLREQLFPNITIAWYTTRDSAVYFTFPDTLCDKNDRNRRMAAYINDTNRLTWNWSKKGYVVVAGLHYKEWNGAACACRAYVKDILLKPSTQFSFSLPKGRWQLSIMELAEVLSNRHYYGKAEQIEAIKALDKFGKGFANPALCNLLVTPPGDSALTRLAGTILTGLPADEGHREERVQALLDFVSQQITTDSAVTTTNYLLRPHEVVMYGKGSPANKVILMASLLEQIGEDYIIASDGTTIHLAISQGNFPKNTGDAFEWDGTEWRVFDVGTPGFRIGTDQSLSLPKFQAIKSVQRPKQTGVLVNPHTGDVL